MRNRSRSATARNNQRDRRFDFLATLAWKQRLHAQRRTRQGLENSGIAIRFQLQLFETSRAAVSDDVAGMFRSAGFIVVADGYRAISVIGEPCLALAFMLAASRAGKVSEELESFLNEVVDQDAQVRNEDHAHVLRSLSHTLAVIEFVRPPCPAATRP
jgi:hypothetical protein